MLFDKLKALLSRHAVSDEARLVVAKSGSTRDILHGLDALHTRNEMEFNDVTREIEKLEEIEEQEMGKVRSSGLSDRRKKNALLRIRRLRKQMENLDNRLKIFDRNMSLHLNLIGKVQDMEAMSLRGLDETQIDKILIDFEEKLESYMDTVASAKVVEESREIADVASERELKEIERDVLGEEPEAASKAKEESLEELERRIMREDTPKATKKKKKEKAAPERESQLESE
ncbi:MAG: hypothetical protein O6952_09345 [Planctomycetota bacterium]|nr:hypothetical protein [Planctomycetota bacterium]